MVHFFFFFFTLKIERKSNESGKKEMFSVFCHCSMLRTLSLVINIIIIITIITTIVFSICPCLWWKIQWKTACCLSELPLRLAERYSLSLLFTGDSGDTFSKFCDEFSCLAVPYASCFYCNRCEQVGLQDALVFLSFWDGWLVCCVSYVRGCCW